MNKTGIQYLDFTWNPVTGCTKGCPECWAREVAQTRLSKSAFVKWAKPGSDKDKYKRLMDAYETFAPTIHRERLCEPTRRKKPSVIGVCFMGDLFDPGIPPYSGKRQSVISAAMSAPQHTFVFLTKQPQEIAYYFLTMHPLLPTDYADWYLGFSARNQAEFDAGWPHMAKLATAGWKVWVSLEPMKEGIDIITPRICMNCPADDGCTCKECEIGHGPVEILSTVIVGAQSGKNAVPFNEDWARSIRDQCAAAGIPFMFKQGHDERGKVVTLPKLDEEQHAELAWCLS